MTPKTTMKAAIERTLHDIALPEFTSHDIWLILQAEFGHRISLASFINLALVEARKQGHIVKVGKRSIGPKQRCNLYAKVNPMNNNAISESDAIKLAIADDSMRVGRFDEGWACGYEKGFAAGAQSREGEIDALREQVKSGERAFGSVLRLLIPLQTRSVDEGVRRIADMKAWIAELERRLAERESTRRVVGAASAYVGHRISAGGIDEWLKELGADELYEAVRAQEEGKQ